MTRIYILLLIIIMACRQGSSQDPTYAEKLGFPKGAKVLILHVDDVGMSWESNKGAIEAIEKGVASSMSVMMPCPWVPGIVRYLKDHPRVDAGLHLTLTSEWKDYRWEPLIGKRSAPGLVDDEGCFWHLADQVVKHASADEVEAEIRAQIQRARDMGFEPTHLDSHMGTLFATPAFLERYVKIGLEYKIPVMFPGGHATMISKTRNIEPNIKQQLKTTGELLWNAGLPVLDDIHSASYGFDYPKNKVMSDNELQKFATSQYIQSIRELKPGLSMVIMHCSASSETFQYITNSGMVRKGDMLAMIDPAFREFLKKEKIILTTWREVNERRNKLK